MQSNQPASSIRRILPALIAGMSMTVFIGLCILAFGLNALFNPNITDVQAANQTEIVTEIDQVSNQEMQALITQYQERETQYQNELLQAADQINQISQQNQQYQQLIRALQNAGVIQITRDGQVLLSRPSGFSSEFEDHDD
jgi:uncharacterized protein YlxW (UPF0749 family)